jgi:regulator of cell morphogenesis and NO signaling
MNFTSESKVKDIAVSNPSARQVLEDAGVDYCCGGGQSLHDACLHSGVSAGEILERLRENKQNINPDAANWAAASLSALTQHIRARHHQYVRISIPRIRGLLDKVKSKHGANHPEVAAIQDLFFQVASEMIMHMQKEEQILFPYIERLEQVSCGNGSLEPPFFQTVKNPIHAMMKEHDSAGELLKRICQSSSAYTPPAGACMSYKALYDQLREFEADLHQHVHLENNILFPRAVELESAVS